MTDRIRKALETVAGMQCPSLADILRTRGFVYEAIQIEELLTAWNEYIREQQPSL